MLTSVCLGRMNILLNWFVIHTWIINQAPPTDVCGDRFCRHLIYHFTRTDSRSARRFSSLPSRPSTNAADTHPPNAYAPAPIWIANTRMLSKWKIELSIRWLRTQRIWIFVAAQRHAGVIFLSRCATCIGAWVCCTPRTFNRQQYFGPKRQVISVYTEGETVNGTKSIPNGLNSKHPVATWILAHLRFTSNQLAGGKNSCLAIGARLKLIIGPCNKLLGASRSTNLQRSVCIISQQQQLHHNFCNSTAAGVSIPVGPLMMKTIAIGAASWFRQKVGPRRPKNICACTNVARK